MALAVLVRAWVRAVGGSVLALIVDHGLRDEFGAEAGEAAARLHALGIEARILSVNGLTRGPGLANRARSMRFAAVTAACADTGILHLLLGHHAADQAETVTNSCTWQDRSQRSGGYACFGRDRSDFGCSVPCCECHRWPCADFSWRPALIGSRTRRIPIFTL